MVALRGRGTRCAERTERARVHAPRARIRSQQAVKKDVMWQTVKKNVMVPSLNMNLPLDSVHAMCKPVSGVRLCWASARGCALGARMFRMFRMFVMLRMFRTLDV